MISVLVNSVDVTSQIQQGSIEVSQKLTFEVDDAFFRFLKTPSKTFNPTYGDDVGIYDGATKIFGGTILTVQQTPLSGAAGTEVEVRCVDYSYLMDNLLAARVYENQTVEYIINDLISSYAPTFTTSNVASTFLIERIVFNQISISSCIKRLADILSYDWYVDENKDVSFFPKYTNSAPFAITDTNGNYIYKTLQRTSDGSQVANRIKVRGGTYDGNTFSDIITVNGSDTKSLTLPYQFSNLTVSVNGTPQSVGIDFIDDFTTDDVLYNYQESMIRFENPLANNDEVAFSGNPKVPVFAVAEDSDSIARFGRIEKLVRDDSIVSNVIARRRATAELYSCSEPIIDAKFSTYTPGLRAGMTIRTQSDIQGFDDELVIKTLTFRMRDSENFYYDVELISTRRYEFVTLLQKLLEPEAKQSDEREVSEEIFTDPQNITITEEINFVAYEEADETMTTSENYILDPLGAGVDAEYMLSLYTPTGQTDTKRPGRLDISLVAY